MFFQKNRNIAIFLSIAALMLWANIGMSQTEWEKYPGNPVLNIGASGTWEDLHVHAPSVLFDGVKYHMWYTGQDSLKVRIGYATSADGIVWNKSPGNPVLDHGASGTWEEIHVAHPTVLFDGTKYQMWYAGYDSSSFWRIGYATSSDGIVWKKHPDNPVLDVGPSGTWDDYQIYDPTILFDGAKYHLWYTGYDGSNSGIGYATSADGIVWEKHPANPVLNPGPSGTWDDYHVGSPTVLFDGTKYRMWYAANDGSHRRTGYATSADGIVWEKHPENPVLDLGSSGAWDDFHVDHHTVLFDDTEYRMWYSGHDGSNYRIGYATSISDLMDTDGDGLPDKWEIEGYNGVDLPGMGADPLHKDIFVEIDWMVGHDHNHKPKRWAIAKVIAAFRDAPVSNPDETTGINLHVDVGELGGGNPLEHDDDLNPVWTEFDAIKRDNFAPEREPIFHYCVFAHNYSGGTSSGLSRGIPASDFIVSLGSWPEQVGTPMQQAGTFMHELGHNIGLRHGGADHVNYKPNYLSIMSYFFQMSGLLRNGRFGELDYSKFLIEDLDENHLNEIKGLDAVGGDDPIKAYGTQYYCPDVKQKIVKSAYRFVDWNCNGKRTNRGMAVDLNNDHTLNTLTGRYNDWDNLIFDGGSIGPTFRISEVPEVFEELTLEEYLRMNPVPLEE